MCYVIIKSYIRKTQMATYVPVIVLIVSAIICRYIAKARNVKSNLLRRLLIVALGPFAIPLIYLVITRQSDEEGNKR